MPDIPTDVRQVTTALIELIDQRLPGQLEAFFLGGSVALGDYRKGQSDVDFVAVLKPPHDVATLADIHADLALRFSAIHCDGIYLRPGELETPPDGSGVEAREGKIDPHSMGERHAVTWLTLADHGMALRGPQPDSRWIMADRDAAIAHSRQNMQSYWRNWLASRRRLVSLAGMALLADEAVVWGALGVSRLHATIQTGRVPSKTGAAEHALLAFPTHARIIAEARHLRASSAHASAYRTALARRRDLIDYMDTVIGSV